METVWKMVRVDDDTYWMLYDVKHMWHESSMTATIRALIHESFPEMEESDETYQEDLECFEES